jgi:pimeloyl-ACP methyl ester carboxylesterase
VSNGRSDDSSLRPFRVAISDADLADLRERLHDARYADAIPDSGWSYGTDLSYLQELARYWADEFDWRAAEVRLNQWPQFLTTIDGEQIHTIHARSPEPNALPLVLSHGWPGSVSEFLDVIEPLRDPRAHGGDPADAFHVIVPSLPGYGFSGPTTQSGWHIGRIASAFGELMRRLGYDRYGVQGGDWGSMVSRLMAVNDPAHVFGVHVNMMIAMPGDDPADMADLTELEQSQIERGQDYFTNGNGYVAIQSTRPQTLAYMLADSPVGLLSWIVEKFWAWTDNDGSVESALSRDAILTNVSIYWFTNTGGSSARLYRESIGSGAVRVPPVTEVPLGVANFPKEIMGPRRRWVERENNLVHWTDMPRGGHFAAMEQPELLVDDIRTFFRPLR